MNRAKAFTLIELLISMTLVSVIFASLFYFSIASIRSLDRASLNARSSQAVRFVCGRISSDIINSTGPSSGSSASKLVIGGIGYQFMEGKVKRSEGSDVYYLTTEGEIRDLKFSYLSSKLVRIEITPSVGKDYYLNAYARN